MTAHTIDHTKGQNIGTVSNQWATRGPDERFTSLGSLKKQVGLWRQESDSREFAANSVKLLPDAKDPKGLRMQIGEGPAMAMTPYGFDNLASMAGVPRSYARKLPSALAAANLRYGLLTGAQEDAQAYFREDSETGDFHLRGITSPRYGRIYDEDVVDAVMNIAGQGTGDTRWKVPGTIDWSASHGVTYNPEVDITTENTTLYASDRDIFLFLVDDMNPIEVGKLDNGDPDLMFRGFYAWNSEVGCRTFGLATMYLRGVCQNRNLWGVEGFSEVTFRHTAGAPERFLSEAAPALMSFAEGDSKKVVQGVADAKAAVVADDMDGRLEFLAKFGFSMKQAAVLIGVSEAEEGRAPSSVWDFSCAVTALARRQDLQETRLALETTAGKMLDKVTGTVTA